jgi:HD-GYP domain-containing protein (c-di-GMP phosphodiesterase class II)
LLFALPLYTTRVAHHRFVEMREMFTQTIASLAQAVDKRDKFTSGHSLRVKEIAVDIGREMRVGERELEALEWGGLLHDVGKIGVPDNVLLKQDRLTRDERMVMNAHPVLGDEIIAPVAKLAAERPIIRHHHEWYNGSGYPDRLIGDEIPKLARILHVADAFEAMTAARPYRMTPLTAEQALAELRKFAGIQFDPAVVDAFVKTRWVDGVADPGGQSQLRPIPLLAQAAGRMAASPTMSQAAGRPEPTAPAH